ncbi:MAG: peptide deformylase [Syntrophobacteraceae bacterium]|nr:peptide deformylase [Desulfobacteraceae bacterium]
MALLQVCVYPDPILRQKCLPVEKVDGTIGKLIDDMAETMYEAPGVGLAANQVGSLLRIIVVDVQRQDDEHGLIVLLNPEVVSAQGQTTCEEGCLSVPDYFSNVKRFSEVVVKGLGRNGNPVEINATGFLAVVLQHEIDHLEGRLFIDRIGPIAKDIFKRRWKKRMKEEVA